MSVVMITAPWMKPYISESPVVDVIDTALSTLDCDASDSSVSGNSCVDCVTAERRCQLRNLLGGVSR